MPAPLTAPDGARLESLGLEPAAGDEPWVRSVRFDTARGTVTLTWDTVAASAHLLWVRGDEVLVEVTRETVEAVTLDQREDGYVATIASASDGVAGALGVTVQPEGVRIQDTLLRV